jgi:hypothetical protein
MRLLMGLVEEGRCSLSQKMLHATTIAAKGPDEATRATHL